MKKKLLFILIFSASFLPVPAQDNNKVRLAKSMYKGNDFSEIIEYSYNADGRIRKIVLSQNGKIHVTTTDFLFNSDGLLISYLNTFNLKISPQKTSITYDAQKRISSFEVKKTQNNTVVKARVFKYNGDTVKIVHPDNLMQPVICIFNRDSNIVKKQGLGEASVAFTNLYSKYDNSKNPLLFLGGYVNLDDTPKSLHNSLEDTYVDIYTINRKIEYQKVLVSQYKPGGPKIPAQYKNGLPVKATETSFDKAYNKIMPVSTITYQYINL